jgi:ectoine hydroxylase-related dioxygenase (phytanoyl-CoA dioxygenase family)
MISTLNLEEVKASFERDGFVKLEQLINQEELRVLQEETQGLIDRGWKGQTPANHYFHVTDPVTGDDVFNRVQFLFPKATMSPNPYLALLGHPIILQVVEKLLEGYRYVLSGEAMVFKMPNNGAEVPVHADGAKPGPNTPAGHTYFNVDIYLDDATLENGCLLAAPGSHKVNNTLQEVRDMGYNYPGLIPVEMKAGDVLFHNTRLVHGSKRSDSPKLRRTLYYEFCSTKFVDEHFKRLGFNGIAGRYLDFNAWKEDRGRLIQYGTELRKTCSYAAGEPVYTYQAPEGADVSTNVEHIELAPRFGGSHR